MPERLRAGVERAADESFHELQYFAILYFAPGQFTVGQIHIDNGVCCRDGLWVALPVSKSLNESRFGGGWGQMIRTVAVDGVSLSIKFQVPVGIRRRF
jgi:hypothetical protein